MPRSFALPRHTQDRKRFFRALGMMDLRCVDSMIDRTGTYDGSGLRVGMIDRACERSHEARRCQPRPLHLRPLRLLAVTAWVGRMDLTCG